MFSCTKKLCLRSMKVARIALTSTTSDLGDSSFKGRHDSGEVSHLSHLDNRGKARMVDVTGKSVTNRTAEAFAKIVVGKQAFKLVQDQQMIKGDALTVSQLAGIMGAKKTSDLIPLCHPLNLSSVKVKLDLVEEDFSVNISCEVKCSGTTGVEMEALTGASIAALTIYDMCKSAGKDMVIKEIALVKKTGGKSDFFKS